MDDTGFQNFLKRKGKKINVVERNIQILIEFNNYLQEQRSKELEDVTKEDIKCYVIDIEKDKQSAKGPLYVLMNYFRFSQNEELLHYTASLREERTKKTRRIFPLKDFLNVNRHTHKRLFDFAFRIFKYIKKSKITATPQIKRDLLENYSNLSRLSSYLNEKNMHKFMESEHDDDNLYQLLTLILYSQEVEKRYGDIIAIS